MCKHFTLPAAMARHRSLLRPDCAVIEKSGELMEATSLKLSSDRDHHTDIPG
jgi:hypothetical protein